MGDNKSKENLQQVLTDGQKQMQQVNSQTVEKLNDLQKSNNKQLNSMNEEMKTAGKR